MPQHESPKKKSPSKSFLNVTLTTFNPAAFVEDELGKFNTQEPDSPIVDNSIFKRRGSFPFPGLTNSEPPAYTKNTPLTVIAMLMLKPNSGITFKDRRWHFILHEKTFLGSECVDWLISTFKDIETREDAVQFGSQLLKKGFFEHIRKHDFMDGHYFYRLNQASMATKEKGGSMGWFRSIGKPNPSPDAPNSGSDPTLPENLPIAPIVSSIFSSTLPPNDNLNTPQLLDPEPIELSKKIIIDLDPQQKSIRKEMALVHYDTIHNPKNCFHLQLHWLGKYLSVVAFYSVF